jgi:phage terminase large subunit
MRSMSRGLDVGDGPRLPIDIGLPVMTTWDLGLNDATSIWFVQIAGREIRFVD